MSNQVYYAVSGVAADAPPPLTAPVNTVSPVIDGSAAIGAVLELADVGLWTGNPEVEFSYAWQRDGADIPGETNPAGYTVTTADAKAAGTTALRLRVRGLNSEGHEDAYSDPITIPAMARPTVIDVKTSSSSGAGFTMVNEVGDLAVFLGWRNPSAAYGGSSTPTLGGVAYTERGAFRVGDQNGKAYSQFAASANAAHTSGAPAGVGNIVATLRGVRPAESLIVEDAEGSGSSAAVPALGSFPGPREVLIGLWAEDDDAISPPAGFEVVTDGDTPSPTPANYTSGGVRRFVLWRSSGLLTSFSGVSVPLAASVSWGAFALAYSGELS